ncbi:unnamed protein product [Sphagnum balticum]
MEARMRHRRKWKRTTVSLGSFTNVIPTILVSLKPATSAMGLATAPNVLFLNNDIRVKSNHEDWTRDLISQCETSLVGPTMGELNPDFSFKQEADRFLPGKLSYMSGWCLASSKENWNKLRLFHSRDTNMLASA